MADIELFIKIPEYLYKAIQSYKNPTKEETAIANGIPLPKGHGKLIDADSLVQEHPLAFVRDVINESEIIVEADAESEE